MVVSFHYRESFATTEFPPKAMPMDAIFAHLTSMKSPVHHPMSGYLLYTFIIYALLLPVSLCTYPSYPSCNNTLCGGKAIPYPFGLRESGCGLPRFQIDCEEDVRRVIEFGGHNYTIVDVVPDNLTSTIVDDDYFKECKSSYDSFDDLNDNNVFDIITQQIFSLKVLKCGSLCVYDDVYLPSLSCKLEEVSVKGAIAHWDSIIKDSLYYNCSSCESSGGWCGYNVSNTGQFLCFCGNATHPNQCPISEGKSSNSVAVIGGVTGGVLAVLLIGGFLIYKISRRRRKLSTCPPLIANDVQYNESRDIEAAVQGKIGTLPIFSYEILKQATNNFAEEKMLGDGGFGSVYLGKLPDGRAVAVKRMYQDNWRRHDQFINEIQILSSLHHPNLVRLYGCTSPEGNDLLLVYEYVKNGTVADHLHGEKKGQGLNWKTRLKISVETAHALAFLHKQEPPVLHRDVKTTNILVDEYFMVKVADFGLSRFMPPDVTHVSTAPQGTPGYLDPEYYECFQLTEKSDVYSFGVVLMELISSKLAVDINRTRKEISLANMALTKIREGALQELVDSNLGFNLDDEVRSSVSAVAELAFRCLQSSKDERPDMDEIVAQLDQIDQNWVHVKNADFRSSFGSDGGKKAFGAVAPPSPTSVQHKWPSTETTPNNSA